MALKLLFNKNMSIKNVNDFHLSYNGYRFLVAVTGYKNKPFKNSDGVFTVGLKHTGDDINPNKVYSDEEIYEFFLKDKESLEEDVRKVFDPRFMNQNMFDAMFSFAYSVGNISNTDLGRIISKNPYDDRIKLHWENTYTNSRKSMSLIRRRKREVELYFKDESTITD